MSDIHSTGRGGAGNIGHDSTEYVDANIVRESVIGEEGAHSAGRGGAGNVATPKLGPQADKTHGQDIIPDINQRPEQEVFHTGRAGAGNVHREKSPQPGHKEHLTDKIKHAIGLDKHHKDEPKPAEST